MKRTMKNKIYLIALIPIAIMVLMFGWSFIAELLSAKSDIAVAVSVSILSLAAFTVIYIINKFKNKTK